MIKIDEREIEKGISPEMLTKLIRINETERDKNKKLYDYYLGRHYILNREKKSTGTANNRVMSNHAKFIVEMERSYIAGNPIIYSASEGFDIEEIKNAYSEQNISKLDNDIIKDVILFGKTYELIYANEENKVRSVKLLPFEAFLVCSARADKKALFGVNYYSVYDIDGQFKRTECIVYDSENIYTYSGSGADYSGLRLVNTEAHYFGDIPLIEHRNNEEEQGDIEQVISLIDAYNLLMSDRVNDKEQFVDAFLFLKNLDIDTETAKQLKKEKILLGYEDSDAKYLSKIMTESDIKVLRDDIKEDIHRMSMVPDMSDQSFGNNLSGVAIKYKLLAMENNIKNKETYFVESLKSRFTLYNNYLVLMNKMQHVPVHRISITFNYNLPANLLELSQMIGNLKGTVSNQTLLAQLPFVDDEAEEAAALQKETAEEYNRKTEEIEKLAQGGGW